VNVYHQEKQLKWSQLGSSSWCRRNRGAAAEVDAIGNSSWRGKGGETSEACLPMSASVLCAKGSCTVSSHGSVPCTVYIYNSGHYKVYVPFSFYNRSTVWARLKKRCEIVFTLASCAPFLRVSSVAKFWPLILDAACVQRYSTWVMLYSLDLSPCWSLFGVHNFYRTGDIAATRLINSKTPPTKQKLLELADPWIGSADFYVCFIGRP